MMVRCLRKEAKTDIQPCIDHDWYYGELSTEKFGMFDGDSGIKYRHCKCGASESMNVAEKIRTWK